MITTAHTEEKCVKSVDIRIWLKIRCPISFIRVTIRDRRTLIQLGYTWYRWENKKMIREIFSGICRLWSRSEAKTTCVQSKNIDHFSRWRRSFRNKIAQEWIRKFPDIHCRQQCKNIMVLNRRYPWTTILNNVSFRARSLHKEKYVVKLDVLEWHCVWTAA